MPKITVEVNYIAKRLAVKQPWTTRHHLHLQTLQKLVYRPEFWIQVFFLQPWTKVSNVNKNQENWGEKVHSDYNYPDADNLQSIKSATLQRCTYVKSLGWQRLVFITRLQVENELTNLRWDPREWDSCYKISHSLRSMHYQTQASCSFL